jgi:hypothetical protein
MDNLSLLMDKKMTTNGKDLNEKYIYIYYNKHLGVGQALY